MSGRSKNEREERALDALIVSQLRFKEDDEVDVEHLPQLTDEDKAALDSLGSDFVGRLLAGEIESDVASDDVPDCDDNPVFAGEEMLAGMNRAEDIDEETAEELKRKRKEIINRVKREKAEEEDDAE